MIEKRAFDSLGRFTPVIQVMLCLGYFGLDAIAEEMEDPFGEDANDLPLSAAVIQLESRSTVMLDAIHGSGVTPRFDMAGIERHSGSGAFSLSKRAGTPLKFERMAVQGDALDKV